MLRRSFVHPIAVAVSDDDDDEEDDDDDDVDSDDDDDDVLLSPLLSYVFVFLPVGFTFPLFRLTRLRIGRKKHQKEPGRNALM